MNDEQDKRKRGSVKPYGLDWSEMDEINLAIRAACQRDFGVIDGAFLCQSVSALNPRTPHCVGEDSLVSDVVALLQRESLGCVLVTNKEGKLSGIFSERDVITKVLKEKENGFSQSVSRYMSTDPVTQPPDTTIAFALNLMSVGGFRHIPIVDDVGVPIGIISVKDVVDFVVTKFTNDLLKFDTNQLVS